MLYMIVRWLGVEGGWSILHYSHDFTDAQDRYRHFKEKYKEVSLLIDERILSVHEQRLAFQEQQKEFDKIRAEFKAKRERELAEILAQNKVVSC